MRHLIFVCLVFSFMTNAPASKLPENLNPLMQRTNQFLIGESEFMTNYDKIQGEEVILHYTNLVYFYHSTRLNLFKLIIKKRFNRELPAEFSRKVVESNKVIKGKTNYTSTIRTLVDNFVFKSNLPEDVSSKEYFLPLLQEIYKNIQYAGFLMSGGYDHYLEHCAPPLKDLTLDSYNAAVRGSTENFTATKDWLFNRIAELDIQSCEPYAKFSQRQPQSANCKKESSSAVKIVYKLAIEDYTLTDWSDELQLLAAKCILDERLFVMEMAKTFNPEFENIVLSTMGMVIVEALKEKQPTKKSITKPPEDIPELQKKLDIATALNEQYLNKAKEAIAARNVDKTEYNNQLSSLKEKLSTLETECTNQRLKIEGQTQKYEKELKASNKKLNKTQNQCAATAEKLKKDLEESKIQNNQLQQEMQNLNEAMRLLEEGHQATLQERQAEIDDLNIDITSLEAEINQLKEQLTAAQENVRMEQLKFAGSRQRHDANEKKLIKLQDEYSKIAQQNKQLKTTLMAQTTEIKKLEKERQHPKDAHQTEAIATQDQTALQARIVQQDTTIASLNLALQMLTERLNMAEARAVTAEQHLADIYQSPLETLNCTWPFKDEQGTTHYLKPTEMHQAAKAAVLAGFMDVLNKKPHQQADGK